MTSPFDFTDKIHLAKVWSKHIC